MIENEKQMKGNYKKIDIYIQLQRKECKTQKDGQIKQFKARMAGPHLLTVELMNVKYGNPLI